MNWRAARRWRRSSARHRGSTPNLLGSIRKRRQPNIMLGRLVVSGGQWSGGWVPGLLCPVRQTTNQPRSRLLRLRFLAHSSIGPAPRSGWSGRESVSWDVRASSTTIGQPRRCLGHNEMGSNTHRVNLCRRWDTQANTRRELRCHTPRRPPATDETGITNGFASERTPR